MTVPTSPYKGIVPFTEEDAPFFFGRKAETQNIAYNLRGTRLTILYGPTGVGKSSVLKAGVSHDLRKLADENFEHHENPELIVVVVSSWSDDPVFEIIRQAEQAVRPFVSIVDSPLNFSPGEHLSTVLGRWTNQLDCELLLILDQFEEYFLYHGSKGESAAFVSDFSAAVNRSDLRVNVLISIREDQLSRLDLFKGRIPGLLDNYLRIEHLTVDAAREAIVKPLKKYNEVVKPEKPYEIQAELVEAVCDQVRTRRSRPLDLEKLGTKLTDVEAPLLQLVMETIWLDETRSLSTELRLDTLNRLGGAEQIATDHLDGELEDFSDAERDVAARVFRYLVTPSGSKVAYSVKDLASYAGLKTTDVEPVLRKLTDEGRILRTVPSASQDDSGGRYELFHDVLSKGVVDWCADYTKKKAIDEERVRLKEQQELQQESFKKQQALKLAEADRRSTRRLIIIFVMLVVMALIAGLCVYAFYQKRQNAEAEKRVQQEKDRLQEEIDYSQKLERAAVPYSQGVLKGHEGAVRKAIFSPDGSYAASASDDGTVIIWSLKDTKERYKITTISPVVDLAYDSSGKTLALASSNAITLFDMQTGATSATLIDGNAKLTKVIFKPNSGNLLVSGGEDGVIKLWDRQKGSVELEFRGHTGPITDMSFSRDGRVLATASVDHTGLLWEVSGERAPFELKGHTQSVNSIRFNADGRYVVTGSDDSTAQLWNALNGQRIAVLRAHNGPVRSADFGSKDNLVVTGGADKIARIWSFESKRPLAELRGHVDEIVGVRFSPDGARVITNGVDHTARIWEAHSGRFLYELRAHFGAVNYSEFSADGRSAITASTDKTARVWKVDEIRVLEVTEARVSIEPANYQGPCPAFIRVYGRITVEGGSGVVKYRFTRNRGQAGVDRELTFDGPGTKDVGSVYKFGGEHFPTVSGTFYLQIESPVSLTSAEGASFNVKCEAPKTPDVKPAETKPTDFP